MEALYFSIAIRMKKFLLECPFLLLVVQVHVYKMWRTDPKAFPCLILHVMLQMLEWLNYFCSTELINVNAIDSRGQTPLHHCIMKGRHMHAKLLSLGGLIHKSPTKMAGHHYSVPSMVEQAMKTCILVLLEDHTR